MLLTAYRSPFGPGLLLIRSGLVRRHFWGAPLADLMMAARLSAPEAKAAPLPVELGRSLAAYFNGLPVDLARWAPEPGRASGFAASVLSVVRGLKWGETASYADVAAAAGRPKAVRAAGTVLSKNPMPLFIPCHRVLAKNGEGGWSGPPGLKAKLLALEQSRTGGPLRSEK